ncbi:MAG: hypothetical protein ABI893_00060 [Polaromonas sp.]|uniref:hypothetical protein n=1 Tax=Polaromonas sp. TaxID=1869339 RepID=UPI0032662435
MNDPLDAHHPRNLQHLHLAAGESLFFHTKAGSALISTSGTLLVTSAPRWLSEQVFRASTVLESGQSHTITQDGWITVTAQHGGAACQVNPAAGKAPGKAGNRLLRYFSSIARGMRARLGSAEAV